MMLVDGRGKLGGHVLTKNRNGAATRTKVTPVNRRSSTQTTARSNFSSLSQNWRALTDAQRASWNAAAPDFVKHNIFGDSYSPTGKNLYMIINRALDRAGSARVTTPPAATVPTALTALTIGSLTTAAVPFTFAATPVAAGTKLIVEATRPLSAGISFVKNQYRFVQTVAAAATSPQDIFTAYNLLFGAPVSGKKIFIRVTVVNTTSGLKTIPLQISGTVA